MEQLFIKLLNMSISAGWVILAILLLRLLLKKAPKTVRCCLWVLAGIRLLCPISLESALSLIPSAEPVPREILYEAQPAIDSGIEPINDAINPILASSLAPGPGDSANPLQIIVFLAARLWFAGMVLMLAYALISALRLRRRVAASIRMKDQVYLCDNISSPFIFGVLFPRIYLPSALQEPQLTFVVAHEKAHLKRRDHWWKPLGFLLLSVYWFHPLCWWAYILLCRDIELACDERVVRSMEKEEKKGYAETLLSWGVSRPVISACPLAFGEVSIKNRVKTVLNYRKPSFWIVLAGILACTAAAVCLLTSPVTPKDVFGAKYHVAEILYDAPWSDFAYTVDNAPEYVFTADFGLMERCGSLGNTAWTLLGGFGAVDYSQEELFSLFESPSETSEDRFLSDAARKELGRVKKIWRADPLAETDLFYLAMQTEKDDVLLAVGCEPKENSHILWLWKMERSSSGYSQEYLASLISSMCGSDVTIFSVYESETMPGKLLAGFQEIKDHSMGFAVFHCNDSQNSYNCTIKGFSSFGKDSLQYITIGEDWGFDHSITLILSRISNLGQVTVHCGDIFMTASPGYATPAMTVLEWPKFLSEKEVDEMAIYYTDASSVPHIIKTVDDAPDGSSAKAAESHPESSLPKEAASSEYASLEQAVSAAIYENCVSAWSDSDAEPYGGSLFPCESHRLLATGQSTLRDTEGFPYLTGKDLSEQITVYLMIMYQEYDLSQGDMRTVTDIYFPARLTFSVAGPEDYGPGKTPVSPAARQGRDIYEGYILEEFLMPEDPFTADQTSLEAWIQENFFPETVAEEALLALTSQADIVRHQEECFAQAVMEKRPS